MDHAPRSVELHRNVIGIWTKEPESEGEEVGEVRLERVAEVQGGTVRPCLVQPEEYGIKDIPVGHEARRGLAHYLLNTLLRISDRDSERALSERMNSVRIAADGGRDEQDDDDNHDGESSHLL
jgi:hypothetical protein